MTDVAFLFTGQGAQGAGMLEADVAAAPEVKALLARVDQQVGVPLSQMMRTGPADALFDTRLAQPALLTLGVLHAWHLRQRGLEPGAVIGHSVGQFAALVTAGALDIEPAIDLVRLRADLMAAAMPPEGGSMAAILGADRDAVYAACREAGSMGVVDVACHNAPGQTVISGTSAAVEAVADRLEEDGALVALLTVSVAAHTRLLRTAAERLEPLVARCPVADPLLPVIDNVTARPLVDAAAVRRSIVRQLTEPVLFEESVETAVGLGMTRFVECGPGDTLVKCVRRKRPDAACLTFREAFGPPVAP